MISDMNQPLGTHVGNSLEVTEAVETLRGRGSAELRELCLVLGSVLLVKAGLTESREEAAEKLSESLDSGRALDKFMEFVSAQGGDTSVFGDDGLLPVAPLCLEVPAPQDGYVKSISCAEVGMASLLTGAGREKKDDVLDLRAGLIVHRKVGDAVRKGESIATVYASQEEKLEPAARKLAEAYGFSEEPASPLRLVHEVLM